MKELFIKCKNLYIQYMEIINYLIFGFLSFVVSMLSYYLLRFIYDYMISNLISWIIAVIFAYVTNRLFVFKSKAKGKLEVTKEFIMFVLGRVFTLILETVILYVMVDLLHINDLIVKVIAQVVVIVTNYILSKLIIFKNKKNSKLD